MSSNVFNFVVYVRVSTLAVMRAVVNVVNMTVVIIVVIVVLSFVIAIVRVLYYMRIIDAVVINRLCNHIVVVVRRYG